jgi:hypothetical protein
MLVIVNCGLARGILQSNLDFKAVIACTNPALSALMVLLCESGLAAVGRLPYDGR